MLDNVNHTGSFLRHLLCDRLRYCTSIILGFFLRHIQLLHHSVVPVLRTRHVLAACHEPSALGGPRSAGNLVLLLARYDLDEARAVSKGLSKNPLHMGYG